VTGPRRSATDTRDDTVRHYAEAAGFTGVDIFPIDNDFYRCYRLTP
jgi:hypothetical protein